MDIDKISTEEAKKSLPLIESGEIHLIDVRTKEEWEMGHAPQSIHFELSRFENGELPALPKDAQIYTCCAAGGRAEIAKNIMRKNGFSNVKNLGGLRDWKLAGGTVVK